MTEVIFSNVRNYVHIKGKLLFTIIFLLKYFKLHIFRNLSLCHLLLKLSYKMTTYTRTPISKVCKFLLKNRLYLLNVWLIHFSKHLSRYVLVIYRLKTCHVSMSNQISSTNKPYTPVKGAAILDLPMMQCELHCWLSFLFFVQSFHKFLLLTTPRRNTNVFLLFKCLKFWQKYLDHIFKGSCSEPRFHAEAIFGEILN